MTKQSKQDGLFFGHRFTPEYMPVIGPFISEKIHNTLEEAYNDDTLNNDISAYARFQGSRIKDMQLLRDMYDLALDAYLYNENFKREPHYIEFTSFLKKHQPEPLIILNNYFKWIAVEAPDMFNTDAKRQAKDELVEHFQLLAARKPYSEIGHQFVAYADLLMACLETAEAKMLKLPPKNQRPLFGVNMWDLLNNYENSAILEGFRVTPLGRKVHAEKIVDKARYIGSEILDGDAFYDSPYITHVMNAIGGSPGTLYEPEVIVFVNHMLQLVVDILLFYSIYEIEPHWLSILEAVTGRYENCALSLKLYKEFLKYPYTKYSKEVWDSVERHFLALETPDDKEVEPFTEINHLLINHVFTNAAILMYAEKYGV